MHDEPSLISTIAIGLTLAFVAALVVRRLGMPSIVGYLLPASSLVRSRRGSSPTRRSRQSWLKSA